MSTSPARTGQEAAAALPTPVTPIWIDSTTKGLLKRVSDDATLLAAVLFNTPTVGCHHVQKHVQSRAPKVIDEARMLGRRMHESYEGLQKDVTFGADFAASMVASRSHIQNIAVLSKQALEFHRGAQREAAVEVLTTTTTAVVASPDQQQDTTVAPAPQTQAPESIIAEVTATGIDAEGSAATSSPVEAPEVVPPQTLPSALTDSNEDAAGSHGEQTSETRVSTVPDSSESPSVPQDVALEEATTLPLTHNEDGDDANCSFKVSAPTDETAHSA